MKNNNEKFENFIRDFDTIKMTSNEKNEMRNNLEVFARTYTPTPSPYFTYVSFFKKSLTLALVLILFVSASKPASAKALPGELLYNVKIIHEKIEAATIKEPEKKVNYEIKRTETRIREAVKLAETKKLDVTTQVKLAADIKEHVEDINKEIEGIKTENPERALALNSELKTTLKVNSEALKKVTETKTIKKKKLVVEEEIQEVEETEKLPEKEETSETTEEVETPLLEEPEIDEEEKSTPAEVEEETNEESAEETDEKEEVLPEPELEIEIVVESFAEFILDSIEDDIEKTESIEETIEGEIVAEENVDTEALEGEGETDIVEPSEILTEELDPEIIVEENSELEPEIVEDLTSEETPLVEVPTPAEPTVLEGEIREDLMVEIASLEHILEAEEKLKTLSLELSYTRDPLKEEEVRKLIKDEKLGQAYIEIQSEIEFLSELKLSRELGITVEPEPEVLGVEETQE